MKSIFDEDSFIQSIILPLAYEIEKLNNEIKSIILREGHFTEAIYPFTIKPTFPKLRSIIENSPQGPIISFIIDDSMRGLLDFKARTFYEEHILSPNRVVILSFDNVFIERDIARATIFKAKRFGIIHNFTMDVDPGYKYIEKLRDGVQSYMMESRYSFSCICFKIKKENGISESFNVNQN